MVTQQENYGMDNDFANHTWLQVPFTKWNANHSWGFIYFGICHRSSFEQKLLVMHVNLVVVIMSDRLFQWNLNI
jgi:hypothetical protein